MTSFIKFFRHVTLTCYYVRLTVILPVLLVISNNLAGQHLSPKQPIGGVVPLDTLHVANKTGLSIDTSEYNLTGNNRYNKSQVFYDSLKIRAEQRKWSKELYHAIITSAPVKDEGTTQKQSGEIPYIQYNGKYIRNIQIQQIDVFGPSVYDTSLRPRTWIGRNANNLHINTHPQVLKNKLLIKPGDKLDAYSLADNERIIRGLPYIQDVHIIVKDRPGTDSVDITIVTKDLWPIGFGMELSSAESGNAGIWNKNIFGFGNEFNNFLFWDSKKSPALGFMSDYKVNNFGKSFISADIQYKYLEPERSFMVNLSRNFFSPNIKYAGGLGFANIYTRKDIAFYDTTLLDIPVKYNHIDAWLGRSFRIPQLDYSKSTRTTLVISARVFKDNYYKRPKTTENSLYAYYNKTLTLGSIGLSSQGYFRSRLIYGFGRTEDIPYGVLLKFTGGYEVNEFGNRFYTGLSFSEGHFINRLGYFYNRIRFGGFINSGQLEQGVLSYSNKYFSPLFTKNRFKYRIYFNLNYTLGINRFQDEFLTINGNEGLTGFTSDQLKGVKKLVGNFESDVFTPYYLYGFRFVFFGFGEIALIGNKGTSVFNNPVYSGIGLGIKIRNERLVFNTLQLRFTYYPISPQGSKVHYIQISGEQKQKPEDFFIKEPQIIDY